MSMTISLGEIIEIILLVVICVMFFGGMFRK